MSKRKQLAAMVAVIVVGVLGVLYVTPWWRVEVTVYGCRVCPAEKHRQITHVFGARVRDRHTRDPWTELLYKDIAEEHEHQWVKYHWGASQGGLGGPHRFEDGWPSGGSAAFWQPHLASLAMVAADQVKAWPLEERRRLYHAIREHSDRESFEKIQETCEQADDGDPNQIWRQWLATESHTSEPKAVDP